MCIIEPGWECDNSLMPSVCNTVCKDGVLTPPEMCDDSTNLLIGCTDTCTTSLPGWTCTPGTPGSTCSTICGDSTYISFTEGCDDGNTIAGDGCDPACLIEPGWACVPDANNKSICTPPCGDGFNVLPTECDAGSSPGCLEDCSGVNPCYDCIGGDAVSPKICTYKCSDATLSFPLGDDLMCSKGDCTSLCGNGKVSITELCDDGSYDENGCSDDCQSGRSGFDCTGGSPTSATICKEICGDGLNVGIEVCDDGNTMSGDGCSGDCKQFETDWNC